MEGLVDVPIGLDAALWDARAAWDIGRMVDRYLRHNPAPSDSRLAGSLEVWSEALTDHAESRLSSLGARRLRAV